jgi:TonB family protein
MKHQCSSLILLVTAVCFLAAVEHPWTQSAQGVDARQSEVTLTQLFQPTYPALAWQARIQGDVEVTVSVRQDGSVESAVVASGHPMLASTALENAQKSRFGCRGCMESVTSYTLVYSFRLATDEKEANQVIQSENHVTVYSPEPPLVSGGGFIMPIAVRSPKCLYLWRCGRRY